MAKPWAEVANSEGYKALAPDQQEAARNQYFEQVVKPRAPQDKLDEVRSQFDAATRQQQAPQLSNEEDAARNMAAYQAEKGSPVQATKSEIDSGKPEPKLKLPEARPSNARVFLNSLVKGAASVPDMMAAVQPTNFVRMASDAAQGKPVELMPHTAADAAQAVGAINPEFEPQDQSQRYIDAAGKGIGAGIVGGIPMGVKSAVVGGISGLTGNEVNQLGVETGHPVLGLIGGLVTGGATGVGVGKALGAQGATPAREAEQFVRDKVAGKSGDIINNITIQLQKEGIDFSKLPAAVKDQVEKYAQDALITGKATADDISMGARQAILNNLPKPMTGTKGQLSNNFHLQDAERTIADTWLGGQLKNKFESDSKGLIENLDALKAKTGGIADSANSFGVSLRGDVEGKAKASMENVRAAYKNAKETVGDNMATMGDDALAWMQENTGVTGVDSLISKAKGMGAVVEKTAEDGTKILVAQPVPIKKLSDLRSFASKSSKDGGTAGFMAGGFKGMVDEAIEAQGGDLYKQAANLRRQHALTYESGSKVVSNILKGKQGSETDSGIATEKLFNNSVVNGSIDDVKNLYSFLLKDKNTRDQGIQQIKNVRAMTTEYLKQAATKEGNSEDFMMGAFENAIKKLGGEDKIRAIYGDKGFQEINNFKQAAQILQKQRAASAKGSPTAARMANLFSTLEKVLEKVPAVGAPLAKVSAVTRQASQAKNALVDPLSSMAKEASKKAGRTPLSELQMSGIEGVDSVLAPYTASKNYMTDSGR